MVGLVHLIILMDYGRDRRLDTNVYNMEQNGHFILTRDTDTD